MFLFFFAFFFPAECAGDPSSTTQTLTVGCRAEPVRVLPATTSTTAGNLIMKIALITLLMLTVNLTFAGGEMKKVCHQEKGKEVCKTIKVHKKLEGTKVPPK